MGRILVAADPVLLLLVLCYRDEAGRVSRGIRERIGLAFGRLFASVCTVVLYLPLDCALVNTGRWSNPGTYSPVDTGFNIFGS